MREYTAFGFLVAGLAFIVGAMNYGAWQTHWIMGSICTGFTLVVLAVFLHE